MGDEQIGQTHLLLQLVKHINNLCLNGHIQCGHRLVTDHKLGTHGQRAGNADTLALTAGELVGIAVGVLGVQTYPSHEIQNLLLPLLFIAVQLVDIQRLADDIGNGHSGIQRGIGILKHHSGLFAVLHQILLGGNLFAVKPDLTVGGLVQVQQSSAHSGLAAAGLAYEAESLASADGERDIVHSLQGLAGEQAGIDTKILLEVLYLNQIFIAAHSASPPFSFSKASFTFIQQAA